MGFAVFGAATSSDLFLVSVVAAGILFPMSWGIGELVSRAFFRPATTARRFGVSICAAVAIGSAVYGAVDTGSRAGSASAASWLVSIGLIVVILSAGAIPLLSARAACVAPR